MHSEQAKNKKTQRVYEHHPAKEQKNGPPAKNKPPEVDPATSCVEAPCANQFEAGLACGLEVSATLFNRGKLYPN